MSSQEQGDLQESGEKISVFLDNLAEEEMVVLKKMVAYKEYKKKMELSNSSKSKGSVIKTSKGSVIVTHARSGTVGTWGIDSWSDIELKDRNKSYYEMEGGESEGKDEEEEEGIDDVEEHSNAKPRNSQDTMESRLETTFLMSLRWENVSFRVKERLGGPMRFFPFVNLCRKRNLDILKVNDLHLKVGSIVGLMGPSGAGKSTLLQILAGRYDKGEVEGYFELEMGKGESDRWESDTAGLDPKKYRLWARNNVGYVSQECHLWETLTVRETLFFSALLYLPASVPLAEKRRKAEEVMKFIGLEEVADVKVGSSLSKGISGGQQKRLSMGIELINAPQVLILDEPTSGLDSDAAMKVIKVLRDVVKMGSIVVVSIHQPNQVVFEQFDQILFLNKGNLVFDGSNAKMHRYAASHGLRCPIDENPADYFMTAFKELNSTEEDFKKWDKSEQKAVNDGDDAKKESKGNRKSSNASESASERYRETSKSEWEKVKRSFFKSGKCNRAFKDHLWVFLVLLYREAIVMCRDWVFMVQLTVGVLLRALVATFFSDPSGPGAALTSAFALFIPLYFLHSYSANSAYRLCRDHHILRWEVSQKLYHEMPFFLARWAILEQLYYIALAQLLTFPLMGTTTSIRWSSSARAAL